MEGLFADEERTSGETTAIARRSKPELGTIGAGRTARQLCSTGKFNASVAADYLLARRDKWIPIGELSRVFYGANIPTGKQRVRRRMSELFNHLLVTYRCVLLYEFEGLRIGAVKVYNPNAELDRQAVLPRIDRMAKRCQWTQRQYQLVQSSLAAETELAGSTTAPAQGQLSDAH